MLRLRSGHRHPPCRASPGRQGWKSTGVAILLAWSAIAVPAGAADPQGVSEQAAIIQEELPPQRRIVVTLYKSRTFRLSKPFAKAVVGAPDIADVLPMSDRAIYLQGKKVGTTNVSVFDNDMRLVAVLDVEVAVDTRNLAGKILSTTQNGGIRVSGSNGQVVLSGEAMDAVAADRAIAIAKGMMPDSQIVNAMRIAPSQQVMLRVRFLEVSRTADRELGVNWFAGNSSGTRGVNTGLGTVTQAGPGTGGLPIFRTAAALAGATSAAPFGVALANLVNNGASIDVMINALETKGVVRRLAEPDLVALSGDVASFLAGGEFPVPTVQSSSGVGLPQISTEYKKFGVELRFVPTVLANKVINLRLTPSVSELDFTRGVTISGFLIPSLTKREASTTIELRDGQSFAIAGLLQTLGTQNISQLPWIGSVPVLGALFRSAGYQKNETDLVVIVTPHLVAPSAPGDRIATPMDQRMPGNDVDFFLLGQPEVRKNYTDYVTRGGQLRGPYGHMIAVEPK